MDLKLVAKEDELDLTRIVDYACTAKKCKHTLKVYVRVKTQDEKVNAPKEHPCKRCGKPMKLGKIQAYKGAV